MKHHLVNGSLRPTQEPTVCLEDIGLLRGYGIFDFFPIAFGRAVFEEDYFARFFRSAKEIGLHVPVTAEELSQQVRLLAEANAVDHGYIRLVLTGGDSENGYTPGKPNLYLMQYPSIDYPPEVYHNGIRLLLQRHHRSTATIKSLNYANALRLRNLLAEGGAVDLLYHDGRNIQETSRANFFIVDDAGTLCTSQKTILAGITRSKVLELASTLMNVKIGALPLEKISRAREAFITSTTKGVLPVTQIDDLKINDGLVGAASKELGASFENYRQAYIASHQHA
ncbi:MAG: aminotransferase class IV [Saprospiraceae bacterium]|nr:aminotransferase class IV [Saprospiraceae bacterium]